MENNETKAIQVLRDEYQHKSELVDKTLKRWETSGVRKSDDAYRYLEVKQEVYDGVVNRCNEMLLKLS